MNVILDMDETLITHKFNPYSIFADPIPRPHIKEFLEFLFSNCKNVSIWTHGLKQWYDVVYEKVLKDLIPQGKSFHFVITRETLIGNYNDIIEINNKLREIKINISSISLLKPLLVIYKKYPEQYNKNNTFIIDDNPITYLLNRENAIAIKSYNNIDNSDTELLRIMNLIKDRYFI
jgi:TFIIF-interacting CTD phosphatase-like protein